MTADDFYALVLIIVACACLGVLLMAYIVKGEKK